MTEKAKTILLIFKIFCILIIAVLLFICVWITEMPKPSESEISEALNPNRDYLIMVNSDNPYDFSGEYAKEIKKDLIYVPDVYGEATPIEKAAFVAFSELQHALSREGMTIGLFSAYRTKEDQQAVYDYYTNLEGWSETNKVVKPGYSEHHTGLLLNVLIWHQEKEDESPIWYTETAERQDEILRFKLLHKTLADYGFIDRYPAGKEKITKTPSEPYEIRFVGSPKIAHEIMDNDLTLEEYLAQKH